MLKSIRIVVALGVLGVPTLVAAQNSPTFGPAYGPTDGEEHHHGPSPESIAACKDKSEGTVCEFDAPRGHESGTCHKTRSGELACFHPHHHPDAGAP